MIYDNQVLEFQSKWKLLDARCRSKDNVWLTGVSINGFDALHRIIVTGYYKGEQTRTWEEPVYYSVDGGGPDLGDEFSGPSNWEHCSETDEKVLTFQLAIPLWMLEDPKEAFDHFHQQVDEESKRRELESLQTQKKKLELSLETVNKQLQEKSNGEKEKKI